MDSVLKKGSVADAVEHASGLADMLRLLHWTGMLLHPEPRYGATLAFYLRSGAAITSMLIFICGLLAYICREGTTDFDRFTMAVCTCNTAVTWVFRTTHATIHQHDFQYLAYQVRRDFDQYLRPPDAVLLEARCRFLRRLLKAYLWGSLVVSIWWVGSSTVRYGFTAEGLPYFLALPYDVNQTANFIATWFFCTFVTELVIVTTMVFDSLNLSIMIQLQLQLVVLRRNLYNLLTDLEETKALGTTQEKGSHLFQQVRQCILHHQIIVRNALLLDKSLSGLLLGQSLSVGAVVCLQLYQISRSSDSLSEVGKFGCYLYIMTSELFVYCWFGDDIILESQNVSLAAYSLASSLHGYPALQSSLMILMTRAQRPLRISAGGLFDVSRESFVAIVNMAYSFFAIIRNFKD